MNFGEALQHLTNNMMIRRKSWKQPRTHLLAGEATGQDILICFNGGKTVSWQSNNRDLLAHDWETLTI